jgi:hypothetical protein
MSGRFYIEVACEQRNYGKERICGDVFLSRKVKEENRTIAVLSDGMGHGVKANMLATLTSTMAVNFTHGAQGGGKDRGHHHEYPAGLQRTAHELFHLHHRGH